MNSNKNKLNSKISWQISSTPNAHLVVQSWENLHKKTKQPFKESYDIEFNDLSNHVVRKLMLKIFKSW